MRTILNQALTTATSTSEVFLAPGAAATVSAVTANMNNGTLYIEQSRNGSVWTRALDINGALVGTVVGTAGAVALAATVIKNEGADALRLRSTLVATGVLAGTITTVFLSANDSGVNVFPEPGVGIANGVGTVYASSVERIGQFIRTKILINITGLNCGGTADDIIGTDNIGVAHLGQIRKAVNGTIVAGKVTCHVVPATGNADIDLWSADEATGVEDGAISALTNEVQLVNNGAHTLARLTVFIALPVDGQYLYLTCGTSTAGTYTAGLFEIELIGLVPVL